MVISCHNYLHPDLPEPGALHRFSRIICLSQRYGGARLARGAAESFFVGHSCGFARFGEAVHVQIPPRAPLRAGVAQGEFYPFGLLPAGSEFPGRKILTRRTHSYLKDGQTYRDFLLPIFMNCRKDE